MRDVISKEGGEKNLKGKQKHVAVCVANRFVFKTLILSAYWL